MTRTERDVALVTGAAGFVGGHLCRALAERGMRVHGLGTEPGAGFPIESWHVADLRRRDALATVLVRVRPGVIVHLAGQSSASRSFQQPLETFEINALGTWNLLAAARREAPEARVLVVGSGEAYGPQPEGTRAAEGVALRPVSPYALSKAVAEAHAEAFAADGLDVVRTRSFSHTGRGQAPTFVIPSWAQQIAAIEAGRAEPVLRVGNLEVTRDLTDVHDVARAYVMLLESGRPGACYNVCRGEGVRLADVAQGLAARATVPVRIEPDAARLRPADIPYLVGDPGAIARDTGWRAELPLEHTLDEVLDEWRAAERAAGPGRPPTAG